MNQPVFPLSPKDYAAYAAIFGAVVTRDWHIIPTRMSPFAEAKECRKVARSCWRRCTPQWFFP